MHVKPEGKPVRGLDDRFVLPPVTVLPHVAKWFCELGCRFTYGELMEFCRFKAEFFDCLVEPVEMDLLQEMSTAYSNSNSLNADKAFDNLPPYDTRTSEEKNAKLAATLAAAAGAKK